MQSAAKAELEAKVDEVFLQCSGGSSVTDFRSVAQVFWPVLDNKISLIDLAGIFTMTTPSSSETLDSNIFFEFFNGVARMKFPSGADSGERLLENFKLAKGFKIRHDLPVFTKAMDKQVIRELLKFDIPLRRAFGSFAGQTITIGGGLTWDEVKKNSIAMEVGGFSSFAGAYSLIPSCLTLQVRGGVYFFLLHHLSLPPLNFFPPTPFIRNARPWRGRF